MHHLKSTLLSLLCVFFFTGCYHESWTYRAVPGVTVTRPYEPGSQGPLVLVSASDENPGLMKRDPAKRAKDLTPAEIARMDPAMGRLLSQRDAAEDRLRRLQVDGLGDRHPKIMEAHLDIDELTKEIDAYAKRVRGSVVVVGGVTVETSNAEPRVLQTVLVLNVQRDYGAYDRSVGRSVVMFIDGNPTPGEYWLTADNSVLITYSAYAAPARTRVGLVGSIKILEVKGDQITANVAIRETVEADTTLWVEKPYDPANWELPWVITGKRTFKITTSEDPVLRKAAVQWVNANDAKK